MRGKSGDEIFLFDGVGGLFSGTVDSVQKDKVEVNLIEKIVTDNECPLKLTIAAALPKSDRQKFLVEKLAELGTHRFVPLQLERSVARADSNVITRFQRYVIESAKQCCRNVLMEISNETTLDNFIKQTQNYGSENNDSENNVAQNNDVNDVKNNNDQNNVAQNIDDRNNVIPRINRRDFLRLLLHPVSLGAIGQITPKQLLSDNLPRNIVALIGPEGSFTNREISTCIESNFIPLAMGARILRTETACVTVAALLLTYAG
jgi:16S rRNA (uracil1498-N3)-methyltransferase